MLIGLNIIRKGGTQVILGEKTYHFKPDEKHELFHVCTVENEGHINRFIKEIPEHYSCLDSIKVAKTEPPEPPVVVTPEPLVSDGGLSLTPSTSTEEDDAGAEDKVEPADSGDSDESTGDSEMSNDEYRERYFELMGEKPHHKKKIETIKAEVNAILNPEV